MLEPIMKCELCQTEGKLHKAELKLYSIEWKTEILNMCDKCIADEGATIVENKRKRQAA